MGEPVTYLSTTLSSPLLQLESSSNFQREEKKKAVEAAEAHTWYL